MNPMRVYGIYGWGCEDRWYWRYHCRRCGQCDVLPVYTRAYITARAHLNWCPALGRQTR